MQGAKGAQCSPQIVKNFCYRNMGGGIGIMQKATPWSIRTPAFRISTRESGTMIRARLSCGTRATRTFAPASESAMAPVRWFEKTAASATVALASGFAPAPTLGPVVEDNQCYENDMAGIGTEAGAAPLIRGNLCHHNKLAGIGARTGAAPTIIGNECHHNQKAGIGQESDAATTLIAITATTIWPPESDSQLASRGGPSCWTIA